MWTNENRARYNRNRLRYPSHLTDANWRMSSRSFRRPSAAATDVMSMSARSSTA
jgi:hypothetical protein